MSGTPQAYQIRPGAAADVERILALERSTTNAPHWSEAAYRAALEAVPGSSTLRRLFLAESPEDSVLHGFAVGKLVSLPTGKALDLEVECELESVVVASSERRQGIGLALCRAVRDWAQQAGAGRMDLEVRRGSAAAIALYRKMGFISDASRPAYYKDPVEDAIIMHLDLNCPQPITG